MEIVLFLYGLAFVALGAVIVFCFRLADDDLRALTESLPWLAGFAFAQATVEWLALFANLSGAAVAELQAVLVPASFLLLFEFGRRTTLSTLPETAGPAARRVLDVRVPLLLLASVAAIALASNDKALAAIVWSHYLVGTSGALLAGIGMLRLCRERRAQAPQRTLERITLGMASVGFLLYAVFGGLVAPHAGWMPPGWIDDGSFERLAGVSPDAFGAACAALIAFAMGGMVFDAVGLRKKIWLLTTGIVALIMAVDLVIGVHDIEQGIHEELSRDARDIRAILMATRRVYHQQFLSSGLPVNEHTVGFLPAHSLSRISKDFPNWSRSGLSFNNVSDRPRNPDNRADRYELDAMAFFRANPTIDERLVEIRTSGNSFYHYTAPIWIEGYCLTCHGERAKAPPSIAQHYDAAYGYQLGDLRGVMSIKLPTSALRSREYGAWFQHFGIRLVGYAFFALAIVVFLNRAISLRLAQLGETAARLASGEYAARTPISGRDEVAQLSAAFNTMGEEIQKRDRLLREVSEERRRAVEELTDNKTNLEQTVYDRTIELQRHAKQLEAAYGELESFSYSVSHDLRAPLRALDGYAQIVLEEAGDKLNDEERQMLRRIVANSERMATLIDDILRFSRVGRADMNWENVDMTKLASGVADELREKYPAAEVRVAALPPATGDAALLGQVWINLIANALKFSSKTAHPLIEIGSETVQGEAVYFVRDNGAGFDMSYAARLFGVFQRLHADSEFPGTGAGLAIVKRIVERHGGRIWAEAAIGKGAMFRFTLAG